MRPYFLLGTFLNSNQCLYILSIYSCMNDKQNMYSFIRGLEDNRAKYHRLEMHIRESFQARVHPMSDNSTNVIRTDTFPSD